MGMETLKPEDDELRTRWTLIRKIRNADCDEESWNEFYGIYEKLIYGLACRSGLGHQNAQDIVQETMRHVCENIRDFVPDPKRGSFKSWLMQMARWRLLDHVRKNARHATPASSPAADDSQRTATAERIVDPASLELEAIWEEEWQKELFAAAVNHVKAQVSPEQFQIFDFYVLKNLPVTKVARSLGVTVAQVYLARHRILKLIKKEVKALESKAQ